MREASAFYLPTSSRQSRLDLLSSRLNPLLSSTPADSGVDSDDRLNEGHPAQLLAQCGSRFFLSLVTTAEKTRRDDHALPVHNCYAFPPTRRNIASSSSTRWRSAAFSTSSSCTLACFRALHLRADNVFCNLLRSVAVNASRCTSSPS